MQIVITVVLGENLSDGRYPRGRATWTASVNLNASTQQRIIDAMQAMPNLIALAENELALQPVPNLEPPA
jgi:hypothetical protein